MSVFDFNSYRDYLRNELSRKIETNPQYSLRALAKNLGLGPSTLSEVLSGRTNFSLSMARRIAVKLDLRSKEVSYFCDLVQLESEKDIETKEQILERLEATHPNKRKMTDLSLDHFKQMSEWHHAAILELPLLDNFEFTIENISRTLQISKPQAELAVDRLLALGLLEKTDEGKFIRQNCDYKVHSEVKHAAMRQYYTQMLAKASDALETQTPTERLSGFLNLPISKKALPEVDQAIDRFFGELKSISAKHKKKDAVYHLSLHFINLTKGKE